MECLLLGGDDKGEAEGGGADADADDDDGPYPCRLRYSSRLALARSSLWARMFGMFINVANFSRNSSGKTRFFALFPHFIT